MSDETRDIAVEARTLAREAHKRQDSMESDISVIRAALAELQTSVAKLNVKVGVTAALGSLAGGGIIAAAVKFLP